MVMVDGKYQFNIPNIPQTIEPLQLIFVTVHSFPECAIPVCECIQKKKSFYQLPFFTIVFLEIFLFDSDCANTSSGFYLVDNLTVKELSQNSTYRIMWESISY